MRKFLLLIALMVLGFGIVSAQNEITIGNGTSSDYNAPFNNYYKHSWNETIYQKGDIGGAGTITSVSYQRASASSYTTQTIKIYMGETTRSSISSTTDWTPANQLTLVYSGSNITIGDSAWETFTLNTPFEYSGENNLVVVVAKTASNYTNSLKWYYTNSSNGSNVTMYRQNDSSESYASHPSGNSGTRQTYAANIKLGIKSIPQPLTYGDTKYINYGTATLKFTVTSVNSAECNVICTTKPTTETAIIIPSKVLIKGNEVSVTRISYRDNYEGAFEGCDYLTSIEIPSSVTRIDNFAFKGCYKLADVYIHDSSTTLDLGYNYLSDDDYASDRGLFDNCHLNHVYLGRNITFRESSYGSNISPFRYKNIPNLTISNSVTVLDNSMLDGVSIDNLYINDFSAWCKINFVGSNPMKCAENIYISNSLVKNLTIPANVTKINRNAIVGNMFNYLTVAANNPVYDSRNNCNAIIETATNTLIQGCKNTIIPNTVTSIGENAFYDLDGEFTSIEIPNSVTTIGRSAFSSCSSLASITCLAKEVPNTIYNVFDGCPSNMVIKVPAKSVSLYQAASPWNNYTIEALPPQIAIGDNTTIAYNGYSLKYTVTSVNPAECEVTKCILTNVTSITIPSTVEINGEDCSVTSIGQESFYYISNVKIPSITIPNTVKSIAREAFAGCKVDNIIIEENSQLTTIGYEAFDFCWMTSFEVPKSVTSIGDRAFCSCESMLTLTFEENSQLISIGSYAFQACCGLTSIEIPSSVTSIGKAIISSLSPNNMTTVIVAEGNTKYDSRNNCNAIIETATNTLIQGCKNTIIPNTVTSIGEYAFYDLDGEFTSIEIPSSITSIGDKAFSQSTYLANITCLAESVPQTSEDAFEGCPSNMKIYVPKSSVSLYQAASPWNNYTIEALPPQKIAIGDNTTIAYDGYSLKYTVTSVNPAECDVTCSTKPTTKTTITIPSKVEIEGVKCCVTSIGESAFSECSYLTNIEIPNTIISIGNDAFWKSGLIDIVFPNSVTSIGKYVIHTCNEIESVIIPNSLIEIGDYNFMLCPKLKTLVVDSNNPIYDSRENCNALIETSSNTLLRGCKNTIIPKNIISIGSSAFYKLTNLNNIVIPNDVISIGDNAFNGCTSLMKIEFPNSLASIGDKAFYGCTSLMNTEFPCSLSSIGNYAFYSCSNLKNVIFEENSNLSTIGEYAFSKCSSMTEVIIPGSVIFIGKRVFDYCSNLKSIKFEVMSQLTSIGSGVISDCQNLKLIEIPISVTSIGDSNFWNCTSLETIVCYADNVPELGYNMFIYCPDYITIYVPASSVEEYEDSQWSLYGNIEAITEYKTCGNYEPTFYSLDRYSQQIYTAEKISCFDRKYITSISLMPFNDIVETRQLKIYMKNITKSEFNNNNDWVSVSESDLVYNGKLIIYGVPDSWFEINLDRAFLYTGDNILLCIYDCTNESWNQTPYFYSYHAGMETGKNYSLVATTIYNDDISSSYGYLGDELHYIRFGFGFGNFVPKIQNLRTFIGNGSWSLVSNWQNNAIPTATNDVLIKGSTIIADNVTVNSIGISNNGSLTIKDGGQLIANKVIGEVTVEKEIAGYQQSESKWYTIASPLKAPLTITPNSTLLTPHSNYDLYRYDEATYTWQNYKNSANNGFTTLELGRGYLYANAEDVTLEFTGAVNTEDVTYTLTTDGSELTGFHLVGNPFTHDITFAHLNATENAELVNGYYVLNGDGAWGATLGSSENDVIKVGQAALVKATEAGILAISRQQSAVSRQQSRNGSHLTSHSSLQINVANAKYSDKAFVVFDKGVGLDKINHENENIPLLYIPVDGTDYAIAMMDMNVNEIPVNFETNVMGEYTISLRQENCEFEELYLLDKETNTTVNILAEDYTFIATSSDNPERFVLIKDNGQQTTDNSHFAYVNNGDIVIYDIEGNGDIQIFDAMGRCVYNGNCCTDAIHRVPMGGFSTGVYMIQKADESGVKVQKIIL